MRFNLAVILACELLGAAGFAEDQKPAADRWETEIRKFEEQDLKTAFPAGANVFVGSSSVRLWKLTDAFPKQKCLNRGFGGSQMGDAARYAERIVIPHKP